MDFQTALLPISSLCGVALGSGLQFVFGSRLEARKQLTVQKSQSYVDFFKAVAMLTKNDNRKENLMLAADAKVRICIYGSIEVINCLHNFENAGAVINTLTAQNAIIELLKAMRKDIGKDDALLSEGALQSILFSTAGTGNLKVS